MLRQTAPNPVIWPRPLRASVSVLWGFALFRGFDAQGHVTKHRKLRCFWPWDAQLKPAPYGDWRFSGRACCESSFGIRQETNLKNSIWWLLGCSSCREKAWLEPLSYGGPTWSLKRLGPRRRRHIIAQNDAIYKVAWSAQFRRTQLNMQIPTTRWTHLGFATPF